MGRFFVRLSTSDRDWYFQWSTVVDASGNPVSSTFGGVTTFSKAIINAPVALSVVAAHVSADVSLGNVLDVLLTDNAQLDNFSNRGNDQYVFLRVQQAAGGKTLTYGTILTELVSPAAPHPQARPPATCAPAKLAPASEDARRAHACSSLARGRRPLLPQALVLEPTRELALQTENVITALLSDLPQARQAGG